MNSDNANPDQTDYFKNMVVDVVKNLLLDALPYPTVLVDRSRTVIAANSIALDMGVKTGEKCWSVSVVVKSKEMCSFCQADSVLDDCHKPLSMEYETDNKVWQIWWVPIGTLENVYLHYCIDITEQRKVEKELKRKDEIFAALIEHSKDIVTVVDEHMNRTYDSNSIRRILGYYPLDLIGKNFFNIISDEDKNKINFEGIKPDDSSGPIIARMANKDGDLRFIEMEITNLLGRESIDGYIVNARDTTEKILAEEERNFIIKKMIEAAKTSSMGMMGSGLVHELNNPLAVIEGFLEVLRKNVENDNIDKDFFIKNLDRLLKQVHRMMSVLEQLKHFNRPRNTSNKAGVAPVELVTDTLLFFGDRLSQNGIQVKINPCNSPALLYCNPADITVVFRNLIENAADSFDGFEPATKEKIISISTFTSKEKNRAIFEVEDNGCGMSNEGKAKLFNLFYTTKDQNKNLGLGLSICRSIIDGCNGEITINSERGMGTCVTISIPLGEQPA